jgi:flagellar FliL protein
MADETAKPAEGAPQETAAPAPGFWRPRNLAVLGAMVVVLGTLSFFGIRPLLRGEEEAAVPVSPQKEQPGMVHSFETLVVNIAGTHGTRYLKVTVGIEFTDKNLQAEINARTMQLLDMLNTIFSGKRMEEVVNLEEREKMKREVRDRFNAVLINGQVDNVFFSEFVVQ